MPTESSPELTFTDDADAGFESSPGQSASDSLAAQLGVSDEPPPFWQQQFNKFGNVAFNSAIVAFLRSWANPPPTEPPPEAGVPEWYAEEWAKKTRGQRLAARVGRDTIAFAAACYLMDGVEYGMRQMRGGKEDQHNKIMGGVAAGGMLGLVWYPGDPRGRSLITVAGAAVGYVTWLVDQSSKAYLLQMQKQLEKELLHKTDAEVRSEYNPWYTRSLVRAKQQQAVAERRTAMDAVVDQQRGLAGPPGGAGAGAGAGAGGRFFGDDGSYGSGDGGSASQQDYSFDGAPTGSGPKTLGQAKEAAGWDAPRSPSLTPSGPQLGARSGDGSGMSTAVRSGPRYGSLRDTSGNDRGVLIIGEDDDQDGTDGSSSR